MRRLVALAFAVLMLTAACGSRGTPRNAPPGAGNPATVGASQIIDALKSRNLPIERRTTYTAATDNRIGRPGQYIERATFLDTRIEGKGIFIDPAGGGTGQVLTFANEADAQRAYDEAHGTAPTGSPVIYVYRQKSVVLMIDKQTPQEQADEYERALREVVK